MGLSASPKGTTTPQSTTELFSPRLADTVFPPPAPQKHRSRIIQTILKMIYRAGPGKTAYILCYNLKKLICSCKEVQGSKVGILTLKADWEVDSIPVKRNAEEEREK